MSDGVGAYVAHPVLSIPPPRPPPHQHLKHQATLAPHAQGPAPAHTPSRARAYTQDDGIFRPPALRWGLVAVDSPLGLGTGQSGSSLSWWGREGSPHPRACSCMRPPAQPNPTPPPVTLSPGYPALCRSPNKQRVLHRQRVLGPQQNQRGHLRGPGRALQNAGALHHLGNSGLVLFRGACRGPAAWMPPFPLCNVGLRAHWSMRCAKRFRGGGGARQATDGLWTEVRGQHKQSNEPRHQPAQLPIRQLLGATDAQTAHHAPFSTAPTHQRLGSANAETTPAGAPAAAADRTQRPDATCEGENG